MSYCGVVRNTFFYLNKLITSFLVRLDWRLHPRSLIIKVIFGLQVDGRIIGGAFKREGL